MSEAWYAALGEERELDVCFELYHENSKIGRHYVRPLRAVVAGRTATRRAAQKSYAIDTAEASWMPTPLAPREGLVTLDLIASLLRAAGKLSADGATEGVEIFLATGHVGGLPAGLFRYDPAKRVAALLGKDDFGARIQAMLVAPTAIPPAGYLFLAGDFTRHQAAAGERGYRHALVAAGRLAARFGFAAAVLGLALTEHADFYDREVDALLGLDGVNAGTLLVISVYAGGEPAGV